MEPFGFELPTPKDRLEVLLRFSIFGDTKDYLQACIAAAYRDFCRTLTHFGQNPERLVIKQRSSKQVSESLNALVEASKHGDQDAFDVLHRSECEKLVNNFPIFTIGHAQKWINMSFKYIFLAGEEYVSGFSSAYRFAHVPIDNVILDHEWFKGAPRLDIAWSQLTKYDRYLDFQRWVRAEFPDSAPLAVEIRAYMKLGSDQNTDPSEGYI